MDQSLIERLNREMDLEGERRSPPEGFPVLPRIPAERYTDPDFFELERQAIWSSSWLLAGHMDELPEPGCFVRWEDAGAPILIVRGDDGEVRAFYNTCRHRGAAVVKEPKGKVSRLRCNYHSWTYDLEGKLRHVPDESDFAELDRSCHGLLPVRCERWGSWIFVTESPDAPPLLEWLGPVVREMEQFEPDSIRLVGKHSIDLACNWKVAADAFLEVYHLNHIHPESVASLLDHHQSSMGLLPNGHSRMVTRKRPEMVEAGFGGGEMLRFEKTCEIVQACNLSYHMFPNLVTPLDVFGFPFLQFWPVDIRSSRLEVIWFSPDWGDGPVPEPWTPIVQIFDFVLGEDTRNVEDMQKSVDSRGFEGARLGYQERRIYHFHEEIDRLIGPENIPERVRIPRLLEPYVES